MEHDEKNREMLRRAARAIEIYNNSYRELFSYMRGVTEPIKRRVSLRPGDAPADPCDLEIMRIVSEIISIVEKSTDQVTEALRE